MFQICQEAMQFSSSSYNNHNLIGHTSPPTPPVKKYLQTIKKINQSHPSIKHENTNEKTNDQRAQAHNRHNIQTMRRRITELELENNQFRVCLKDYEQLANRNRQLEEQMLLLLQEISSREEDQLLDEKITVQTRVATRRKEQVYANQQYYNTNQSSHQDFNHEQLQYSQKSGSSSSKQLNNIQPFDFIIQNEELMEENAYLKAENLKIKELIDLEVKESIRSLEEKMMEYIASMEQKMQSLNQSQQEINKLRSSPSFDSRVLSDKYQKRWGKSSHSFFDKNQLFVQNPIQISIDLSNPCNQSNQGQEKNKQSSEGSCVDMEMSFLSDSNQSFGKTIQKRSNGNAATPQNENNLFNNIKCIESPSPIDSNIESIVIGKIWEDISNLRTKLIHLMGQKSRAIDPSQLELEKKVETQMKSIVKQFFPAQSASNPSQSSCNYFENIQTDILQFQNKKLQQKVHHLEEELALLRRNQIRLPSSRYKPASQIYLEQSYYMDIHQNCQNGFEQTKRKLLQMIEVIKSFNNDVQAMFSHSKSTQQLTPSL